MSRKAAELLLNFLRNTNWMKQKQLNPEWCGEPPTSGLKEKIKKERIQYKK